jgi:DNA-binding CsgD family transcriptional regulator
MYVSLEKLQRATNLIDSLADLDQSAGSDESAGASEFVLAGLASLVECDVITYQEIGINPDRLGRYTDFPEDSLDPASVAVFETYFHEHPLLVHYRATGSSGPAKISDFVSRRRFHRLSIYSEYFRHIPVDDQIAFSVDCAADGLIAAFALSRSGSDFSDDDRAILCAIKEPLTNGLRRVRDRRSARAALAAADSGTLTNLTDREAQILQLAARGRTNRSIAREFGVSPRTVAKHLEHIYRKLGVTSRAAAVYRTLAAADLTPHATGVVDHLARELGLLDRAEAAVVDEQRDDVGLGDRVLSVGHDDVVKLVELGGKRRRVRLGHQDLDVRQGSGDPGGDVNGWALPQVAHVGLERQAKAGDPRVAEPPRRGHDLIGGMGRHMVVDRTRDADQPGQVWRCLDDEPRVHGYAVPADARARPQDVDPRVVIGHLPDLPDVQAQALADQRELVGKRDVHVPVGVLG